MRFGFRVQGLCIGLGSQGLEGSEFKVLGAYGFGFGWCYAHGLDFRCNCVSFFSLQKGFIPEKPQNVRL